MTISKSKKILVTGACGFIGSHLCELLIKRGFSIIAFDRYNINNNLGWLENSKYRNKIEFILGDIRDYDSVYKAMQNVDYCIHLAALIGIPYSYFSPLAYIRTNCEGTYNILESSKNLKLNQVLLASTSETYGDLLYAPIDENHPQQGNSPYSASKIAADQLAISYFKSFGTPVKIFRPFNVYGPRQSNRAIIPTIINQMIRGNVINLGNINIKRDFTFVNDTCLGIESILYSKKCFGEIVNIGSNVNYSINEIINILAKKTGKKPKIKIDKNRIRPNKSEVFNLLCDNKKIIKLTDWNIKTNFEKGLSKTYDWFLNNQNLYLKDTYHE